MKKNSVKNSRVSVEVQRHLAAIIREEVKDPRVSSLVSVTEAVVAPDLSTCKAYISVLGSAEDLASTVEGLQRAEGYIRRELAHRLNLRNTPEIRFIADDSIAYGVEMTHRLTELVAEIPDRPEEEEDEQQ